MSRKILIPVFAMILNYCYSQQHGDVEYIKNETPFIFDLCKNREMVDMYISGFFDTTLISCNNQKAITVFKQRIEVLKIYINSQYRSDLMQFAMNAIVNFELLTEIESQSDADFIGKYKPTEIDIVMWMLWLQDYKNHLCWYEQKNILFFRE